MRLQQTSFPPCPHIPEAHRTIGHQAAIGPESKLSNLAGIAP
jgi:hypothetical protein